MKPYLNTNYLSEEKFISYLTQIRLVNEVSKRCKIIEMGMGNGCVRDYLIRSGYDVRTLDIQKELNPDYNMNIKDLDELKGRFKIGICSEVLEHLPAKDFKPIIKKISRKCDYLILSLPYPSLIWLNIKMRISTREMGININIPKIKFGWRGVTGNIDEHKWEIDLSNYRLTNVEKTIKENFYIIKKFRPKFTHFHYFFLLKSKRLKE